MINIIAASKAYGTTNAVRDVNLTINTGSLFGLIGPDGSGKTSLFRMITTLLKPDTGTIKVFGKDSVKDYKAIRKFTGYMPGRFSLYPDLTVEENLFFYATIFKTTIKENYEIIKPVYKFLEPFKNRLSKNLSGGMKQKLALCCALIHNPMLLVLDEPTTGVDAVSRKEFWEMLYLLKQSGMTILVSTPYMDEAEKCDYVALMQNGFIIAGDTPKNIMLNYKIPLYEIITSDRLKVLQILREIREIKSAYLFGHSIHVAMSGGNNNEVTLKNRLIESGNTDINIQSIEPDFEDCFINAVETFKINN